MKGLMSDSWIDKDELEQLLGDFSEPSRKPAPRKQRKAEIARQVADDPVAHDVGAKTRTSSEPIGEDFDKTAPSEAASTERSGLWTAPGTTRSLEGADVRPEKPVRLEKPSRAFSNELFSALDGEASPEIINQSSVENAESAVGVLPSASIDAEAWFAPVSLDTVSQTLAAQSMLKSPVSDEEESRKATSLLQETRARAERSGLLERGSVKQVEAEPSAVDDDWLAPGIEDIEPTADDEPTVEDLKESEGESDDLLPRILVDNERTQWFLRGIEDWVDEDEAEPFQSLTDAVSEQVEREASDAAPDTVDDAPVETGSENNLPEEQGSKTQGALVDRLQEFALELAEVLDARNVELFDRDGYPLLPVQRAEVFRSFPRKELQLAAMQLCETEILDDFAVSQVRNGEHGWACLLPCWARDPRFFVCFDRAEPLDDIEVTTWRKELSRVVLGPTVAASPFSSITN